MRIAQVAPLWETVPPRTYGGTELVVFLLTEELIKQGHEVTLFTVAGSQTQAEMVFGSDFPLRDMESQFQGLNVDESLSKYPGSCLSTYYEMQMLDKVFSQADRFDVIHNHLGFITLPFANLVKTPVLTTLHGAFKSRRIEELVETKAFEAYAHQPFVSISDDQRKPCPQLNYVATVYHGLDLAQYEASYTYGDKDYLAFLGRFCYDKGPHQAIQVAKATGMKLIMAGKVDCIEEKDYFEQQIKPHIDGEQIQYIGELNHPRKTELLRNAAATLCPVNWPEPFGLVLTESMACGTPVLAFRNGSIPELVRHGETGFVVDTVDEMIDAIQDIGKIDRRVCRHHVESNFSVKQMTRNYVKAYKVLTERAKTSYFSTRQEGKILQTAAVLAPQAAQISVC